MSEASRSLIDSLRLPIIAAPMFLVSGPDMASAASQSRVACGVPTLNARDPETLDEWLSDANLEDLSFIPNIIVHRTNPRAASDLELIARHRPRAVISALGNPAPVVEVVHAYGGIVLADVNSMALARKAIDAGADGLVLVCAGAGGHTGAVSPFAFLPAVRAWFDGLIVAGGAVSDGYGIRAMQLLGADLVAMGTRFIATTESMASDAYRSMIAEAELDDIVPTAYFTGVTANYLWPSIENAGISRDMLNRSRRDIAFDDEEARAKAWKDIWSAGQGVGGTDEVTSFEAVVTRLTAEYERALGATHSRRPQNA